MVLWSLWVITSLLKEEVISGGTFLASFTVGGRKGEQGWGERCLSHLLSDCTFLSFLVSFPAIERWKEAAPWVFGHRKGAQEILKPGPKVQIPFEKNSKWLGPKPLEGPTLWFSKLWFRTSGLSITWDLVKNAHSEPETLPGAWNLCFKQALLVPPLKTQVWEPVL